FRSLPSKEETSFPVSRIPRSRARRVTRRVSSAATTSAPARVCRARSEASAGLPSGAPTSTTDPSATVTAYDVPVTRLAPADVAVRDPEPTEPSAQAGVPEIVQRRLRSLSPGPDAWSWVVAGVVTLVAGIVRLVDLGHPGRIIFDETYYSPNAYALLKYGVEWQVHEGGANPV